MSAKDCAGHFSGGWSAFYESKVDVDLGKPHLRTWGANAEKFFETSKLPLAPARPGKAPVAPSSESLSWGVGGSLPQGKRFLPVPAADGFKISQKKYLPPPESEEAYIGQDTGRKGQVYDAAGVNYKCRRGKGFTLEDVLQRKGRVTEEMRSESRTIDRMAPPGLKGFMGAEYSLGYFTEGRDHGLVGPKAVARPHKKTFKQKRAEQEVAEQVALVNTLKLQLADGEPDSDDEPPADAYGAAPPAAEE